MVENDSIVLESKSRKYPSLSSAWIPMSALCLAFFVEMVDNTLLTIALPTIGRDLNASTTQLQWVTGAYSLTFGALLLLAGTMADRFGRKKILLAGLFFFGLISSFVWFVNDINHLILLRALLGVAAAGMAPVTMSLVFRLFEDEKPRMRAITLLITIGMSAMALGPVLAGTALTKVSWHWLLFINGPIALIAILGVLKGVSKDLKEELHPEKLDLPGTLLTMIAMSTICYSMTSGVEKGWSSIETITLFVIAIASIILFLWWESKSAHPMIDLSLLKTKTVRGALLTGASSSTGQMAVMFLLILHFQYVNGWTPLRAGLANLPFVLTMILASPFAEAAIKKFGHRLTCVGASILLGLSMLGLSWSLQHSYWVQALAIVGITAALRVLMTVCAVALVDAVPEQRTSLATALNDVAGEFGTSFGVAVVGTILASIAGANLPEGAWSISFQNSFIHAEQVALIITSILVTIVCAYGCSTLTNSKNAEEH